MLQADEARVLLGLPANSRPTPAEVKAAYKRKVWETHPDRFPVHEKSHAECKFKSISEAYMSLQSGGSRKRSATVVRSGVPRAHGGRRNQALIGVPFIFIIMVTVGLGGLNASRAYQRQKEAYPSHNPFLP
ncbi:hypothetical protein RJ640_021660 [Escallonia rubra]|uniref:J domain-containing protein n=1 Tax=Escallonia rubra TaxID=112253 RepID=A0AA88QRL2_9ASTE|nr:hypothetical protein RJ640_021660 [Escallonia rubra]